MDDIRGHLARHEFKSLFIERLGWDHASGQFAATGAPGELVFTRIAHKRGVQAFVCQVDYPTLVDRKLLRRVEAQLSHHAAEHVAIYHCQQPRQQCWQWAAAGPDGKRLRHREHPFTSRMPPEKVISRIHALAIAFEAEDSLTVSDVSQMLRGAFDNDPEFASFFRGARWRVLSESLHRRWRESRSADDLNAFLEIHLPLLAWAVKKFAPRRFDPEDAFQAAFFGLRTAAQGFDPDHGAQFSTYASRALMQRIIRAAPAHLDLIKRRSTNFRVFRHLERQAERLSLSDGPRNAAEFLESEVLRRTGVPAVVLRAPHYIESLDDPTQPLSQMLEAKADPLPPLLECLIHNEHIERLPRVLASLHEPRLADVIAKRFGLDGRDHEHTLQDIGDQYGLTKERIRQIEVQAITTLRARFDAVTEREQAARSAWQPKARPNVDPLPPLLTPTAVATEPQRWPRAKRLPPSSLTFQLRAQPNQATTRLFDAPAPPIPANESLALKESVNRDRRVSLPDRTSPQEAVRGALDSAGAAGLLVTELIVALGCPGAEVRATLHALAQAGEAERTPELRWRLSHASRQATPSGSRTQTANPAPTDQATLFS